MPEATPLHPRSRRAVTGIDLRRGVTAEDAAWLRAALDRHAVLVLPGQDIDDAQQIAFSEAFGPLEATRPGARGAGSPLIVLSNMDAEARDRAAHRPAGAEQPGQPPLAPRQQLQADPARASALRPAPSRPAAGRPHSPACARPGRRCREPLRAQVRGRVAVHDFGWSRSRIAPDLVSEAERTQHPPVRQAMLLEENRTGRRSISARMPAAWRGWTRPRGGR